MGLSSKTDNPKTDKPKTCGLHVWVRAANVNLCAFMAPALVVQQKDREGISTFPVCIVRHQGLEPREVLSHYQTRISAGKSVFSGFSVLGKTVAHSRVPNLCPITER